jgi:hypothetical protein
MRFLGRWTLAVFVEFPGFFRRNRIGSAFGAHCLGLMGFVAALVMVGEASAGVRFSRPLGAGDVPQSIAVADLDGDTVPDLVTANSLSDDVSVLLGNGDGTFRPAAFFAVTGFPSSVAVADLK